MLHRFRWRIAIPYILLILVLMGALGAYFSYNFRQRELKNLEAQLRVEARLLGQLAEPMFVQNIGPSTLVRQVKEIAGTVGSRVTLIAPDGTVLADSEQDIRTMDNHLDRPEVQQALQQGEGMSVRFSRTQAENRLYYAFPVREGDEIRGIVRLSVPLAEVQRQTTAFSGTILVVTTLAAGLALLLAVLIAQFTARPVLQLSEAVDGASPGDPAVVSAPDSPVEVARLGRAFQAMRVEMGTRNADLETERSKLAAVLDQMTDGVIIVDGRGRVQLINPAAEHMFSILKAEAQDQSLVQVIRHHQIVDLWRQCQARGESQATTIELTTRSIFLQGFATPLENVMAGSILLVFQDVTHLRRLESVRRDFISNISHELRTPLASLKALTETLLESALEDPAAARRFLTRMETEVDALSLMVQELVELSRIESGKVPLNLVLAHPNDLIESAVERLRLQAERANLSVEVDCPPELPPVLADPLRMEQVIVNLLHNAIKFTPPGGRIRLSARLQGERVIFTVEDNGIGISSDDLPRIFERFYKSDRARSGEGTGLGLAIARHLVEAHDGRIWAESIEGQGSTFHFDLPLAG
jgi:two-component system phosphate regulon sensor histidine kinase PhoR